MYGIHGVCRILDLEQRKIDRKNIEYYVLEPIDQPGARFYVPTQNEAAVSKLRPVITQQELNALLKDGDACTDVWIEDENQRKQYYRELICSGDRERLIRMVCSLYRHKAAQSTAGRKVHLCDENFLHDAEKLLTGEAAIILNLDMDAARTYLRRKLKEDA